MISGTDVKFIDLLNINEKIIVSDKSYRTLFNESSLLITDYSSVAFDFAYLKKPIIYYQPDDDYHHGKSYFDFEEMGFGRVIKSEEKLKSLLRLGARSTRYKDLFDFYYLINNCEMELVYMFRVEKFYKFIDNNNCKRVYNWIKNH